MNITPQVGEKEVVKCATCGAICDIDLPDWPKFIMTREDIIIMDYFCKKCGKILYGYTKLEKRT